MDVRFSFFTSLCAFLVSSIYCLPHDIAIQSMSNQLIDMLNSDHDIDEFADWSSTDTHMQVLAESPFIQSRLREMHSEQIKLARSYQTKMLAMTESIQNNSVSFFRGVLTGRIESNRWAPILPWQDGAIAKLTGRFGRIDMLKLLKIRNDSKLWRDSMQYAAMYNQSEFLRYFNVPFDVINSYSRLKLDIPEWNKKTLLPSLLSLNDWDPVYSLDVSLHLLENFYSFDSIKEAIQQEMILPSDKINANESLLEYIARTLHHPRDFFWLLENGAFIGDRSESSVLSLVTFLSQKSSPRKKSAYYQVIARLLSYGHRVPNWLAMVVFYHDDSLLKISLEHFIFKPQEFQVALSIASYQKNEFMKRLLSRYVKSPLKDQASPISWAGIKYPSHFTKQDIYSWYLD